MKCPYCGMHYVTASCPRCNPNPHYMAPPPTTAPARYNMPQAAPPRSLPVPQQPGQYPPAGQYPSPAQPPRRNSKINPVLLVAAVFTGIAVIAGCFRFTAANLLWGDHFTFNGRDEYYPMNDAERYVPVVPDGYYPAGSYTVGKDIPIGTFLMECDSAEPATLDIETYDEAFSYEAYTGQYVTLKLGESIYLYGGTLIDAEDHPDVSLDNPFAEMTNTDYQRMFMAGRDFPAGTYLVMLNSDAVFGNYIIADHGLSSSDTLRETDALIDGSNNSALVQINEGEILTLWNTVLVDYSGFEYSDMIDKFPQEGEYYPEGDYTVGKDIASGRYIIYPEMPFEMLSSHERIYGGNQDYSNGSDEAYFYMELTDQGKTVISGWKSANCYVDLEDGQQLHLDGGRIVSTELYGNLLNPYSDPGMYVVGNDLPAGTYMLVQNGYYDGDCIVFPDVPNDLTDSVSYLRTDDGIPIELKDGQCIQLYCSTLLPVSD